MIKMKAYYQTLLYSKRIINMNAYYIISDFYDATLLHQYIIRSHHTHLLPISGHLPLYYCQQGLRPTHHSVLRF